MKNQKLNISKLSSYEKKQAKKQQSKIKPKKLQVVEQQQVEENLQKQTLTQYQINKLNLIQNDEQNDRIVDEIKQLPFDERHAKQTEFSNQKQCVYFVTHITDYLRLYKNAFIEITYLKQVENVFEKEGFEDNQNIQTSYETKTIILKFDSMVFKKLKDYQNANKDATMFSIVESDDVSAGSAVYHAIYFKIFESQQLKGQEIYMNDKEQIIERTKNHANKGKFFSFRNDSSLNLKRYQIYKMNEKQDLTHCLIYSLQQSNQLSKEELYNTQQIMRQEGEFNEKDIKKLKLSKDIIVYNYVPTLKQFKKYIIPKFDITECQKLKSMTKEEKQKFKEDKQKTITDETAINICCFMNHYFINEKLDNYKEIIYTAVENKIMKEYQQFKFICEQEFQEIKQNWNDMNIYKKLQAYFYQQDQRNKNYKEFINNSQSDNSNDIEKSNSENNQKSNSNDNSQNDNSNDNSQNDNQKYSDEDQLQILYSIGKENRFELQYNKKRDLICRVNKINGAVKYSKDLILQLYNLGMFYSYYQICEDQAVRNNLNLRESKKQTIDVLNEIPFQSQRKFEYKEKEHQNLIDVIDADFESFTKDDQGNNLQHHKNFMLCFQSEKFDIKLTCKNVNFMINYLIHYHSNRMIQNQKTYQQKLIELKAKIQQTKEPEEKNLLQEQKMELLKSFSNQILIKYFNLSYDAQFIIQSNYQIENLLSMNGRIISFDIIQKVDEKESKLTLRFHFVDNLMLFNCKLSELPKMLLSEERQKTIYKELFPYEYYTQNRYSKNIGNIEEAVKCIQNQYGNNNVQKSDFIKSINQAGAILNNQEFEQYIQNLTDQEKLNLKKEDYFNMFKYAEYYCQQDVTVQKECNLAFEQMVKQEFNLNINDFLSISSLSFQYQKDNGVFENIYESSGVLRQYLSQFQVGGRTQTGRNLKWKVEGQKIGDFDAVSLYPSAQNRLYYPAGKAKVLTQKQIQYYNIQENLFKLTEEQNSKDKNTLFLTVKLFKDDNFINKMIPILSQKTDEGIRYFKNNLDLSKPFYLTHVALQDAITFQHYKYQIIGGVYYSQRNYKINEVVKTMFEKRLHYKSLKNPIQIIYKLCLNSSYGKLIEGIHDKNYQIINDAFDYDGHINETGQNALCKNYDAFSNAIKINDKLYIETLQSVNQSFNFSQCGVFVLDYSKRIVNELLDVIENLKVPIYYVDSDSQQFPLGDWNEDKQQFENLIKIENKFYEKYQRKVIGKQMGQFHLDYESDKGDVLYADKAIYLGKKAYICNLIVKTEDGKLVEDSHIRLKGVNQQCIIQTAKDRNQSVYEMYNDLFNKEEITFDQCEVKTTFSKGQTEDNKFLYTTIDSFARSVKFNYKLGNEEFKFDDED